MPDIYFEIAGGRVEAVKMEKADKVTIRLTTDQADALDFLVAHGQFRTRSDAIRAAIDLMTSEPEQEVRKGFFVDLPDGMIATIDRLVDLDHFRNRDHGVFEFIRNGLDSIDVEEVRLKQEQRLEILAEKKTSDILEDVYRSYVDQ
ncbi:MAG: ribbon-helix-helix protein, CopG family [Candidatus Thermoplasmatota archaeon]|nr:ribbon-helix-helix protein, CopG family [Candidatus Thermoplasmatota archaeon]